MRIASILRPSFVVHGTVFTELGSRKDHTIKEEEEVSRLEGDMFDSDRESMGPEKEDCDTFVYSVAQVVVHAVRDVTKIYL